MICVRSIRLAPVTLVIDRILGRILRLSETMSEQLFTTLQPVILGNDENDEISRKEVFTSNCDETFVKQVYSPDDSSIDCAQKVTSLFNVNISSRKLVNVTAENVNDLYEEITGSNSSMLVLSQSVQKVLQSYRELPKDLFLSKLLSDYHSDEIELKEFRNTMFVELKALEEFPFPPGSELKRRKQPRIGESAAMKLCSDIYVLTSVLDGAPFEDMKELISMSKYNQETYSQNDSMSTNSPVVFNTNNHCKHDDDIALFRSLLTIVQADLFSLKQENNSLKTEFKEDIKSIKSDVKLLKSDISDAIDQLQTSASECHQAVERITDDRYNGVASAKSDIKQLRTDLRSLNEFVELKYNELNAKLTCFHKLDKRLTKIEKNRNEVNTKPMNLENTACNESAYNSGGLNLVSMETDRSNSLPTTNSIPSADEIQQMQTVQNMTLTDASCKQNGKLVQCPETEILQGISRKCHTKI